MLGDKDVEFVNLAQRGRAMMKRSCSILRVTTRMRWRATWSGYASGYKTGASRTQPKTFFYTFITVCATSTFLVVRPLLKAIVLVVDVKKPMFHLGQRHLDVVKSFGWQQRETRRFRPAGC